MIDVKVAGPAAPLGSMCPFCKCELRQIADIVRCVHCNTHHHSCCWNLNKGSCTVFSCSGKQAVPIATCVECGDWHESVDGICRNCRTLPMNKKVLHWSLQLFAVGIGMLTLFTLLQSVPFYAALIAIPPTILLLAYSFASVFTSSN